LLNEALRFRRPGFCFPDDHGHVSAFWKNHFCAAGGGNLIKASPVSMALILEGTPSKHKPYRINKVGTVSLLGRQPINLKKIS
jgi:hypothetical protein